MKICSQCKIEKPRDAFFNFCGNKDGKTAACKQCTIKKQKERYLNNKNEILLRQKEYYKRNKEKIKQQVKKYRLKNVDKVKRKKKSYYLKNKAIILKKTKQRYNQDSGKSREINNKALRKFRRTSKALNNIIQKKYRNKNIKKINARHRERWANDPKHRLRKLMSCRMRLTLKKGKNGSSWESLVDYTVAELECNLKHKIPKGYTCKDFMEGKLHIDHKVPVAAFNFTKPADTDFKRCWALNNLQLLPALKNIKKGSKLSKPFQPSLPGI